MVNSSYKSKNDDVINSKILNLISGLGSGLQHIFLFLHGFRNSRNTIRSGECNTGMYDTLYDIMLRLAEIESLFIPSDGESFLVFFLPHLIIITFCITLKRRMHQEFLS